MLELHPTPENRLPPGAILYPLKTADGILLRGMKAGDGRTKGTVLLLQGRAEYLERYFETMRDLISRGYYVASFDWRGQGGSQRLLADPLRGHVTNFKSYDEDLRTAMDQLVRAYCPGPYYALGHSTGGHILLRNIVNETWFSKTIVTAPLTDLHYGSWPRWLARFTCYTFVRAGLARIRVPGQSRGPMRPEDFDGNDLSSDHDRYNRDMTTLARAGHLGIGGPTMGWLNAAMESMDKIRKLKLASGPKCPVLIVLAGRDRVVSNSATQDFALSVPGLSIVTIPESLHEILQERDVFRAEFFAAFDSYLGQANA